MGNATGPLGNKKNIDNTGNGFGRGNRLKCGDGSMHYFLKIVSNTTLSLAVIFVALLTMFAIKPHYGGEVTLRLNEPSSFAYTPSDYSNLIFYSLLYENLFYLEENGDVFSNVFTEFKYNAVERTLTLDLKKNLAFSNGTPVGPDSIQLSIKLFLNMNLETARNLGRIIKSVDVVSGRVIIRLMYDNPDIVGLLTAPELVLMSGNDGVFSGLFTPVEWEKGRHIKLVPNKYYPGGRSYLDSVKVIFYDYYYPDIFLSKPAMDVRGFGEFNAGIYQNIYLSFPSGKVGNNTRIAVYSLLKDFSIPWARNRCR